MSAPHDARPASIREGWYGYCYTCEDRGPITSHQEALEWCDEHMRRTEFGVYVNDEVKKPSLKTLVRVYRDRSSDPRWTDEERVLWGQMADEMERRVAASASDQDTLF